MIDPLKLHAYVDGQLTVEERIQVERELSHCEASQREVRAIQSIRQVIATNCESETCSRTWQASLDRLNELDNVKRTERFVGKYAWALCAGVFAMILVGGTAARGTSGNRVATADLASFIARPASAKTVNTEQARINQALDGLLSQAKASLSPLRLRPVALSVETIDGHLIERVLVRDAKGDLTLVNLPEVVKSEGLEPIGNTGFYAGHFDLLNCVVWQVGDRTLLLVGNRPHAELLELVRANFVSN